MSAIELDDLKSAWQTLNRNLERHHTLALHQFKEARLARFRSGFRPLIAGQIIQLLAGLLLALFAGSFWLDHIGRRHLMFYGISLHAYGILLIVFAARDLFLVSQLDYAAPVVLLQKQIANLRAWHVRAAVWFGVAGCFIWIPLLLIIFYRLGADVWVRNPDVVGWFVLSALICAGLFYGIIFWSRRPGRQKLAESLVRSSAGRSVTRAQEALDEIALFEQE